jgi:hypothetical protein
MSVRLDEFTKNEWLDVARKLKPDLSDQEYDKMWDEFLEAKVKHKLN